MLYAVIYYGIFIAFVVFITALPFFKNSIYLSDKLFNRDKAFDNFHLPDEFAKYYQEQIEPQNNKYEQLRIKYLKQYFLRLSMYVLVIIFAVYYLMHYMQFPATRTQNLYIWALIAFIFAGGYFVLKPVFVYKDLVQNTIFPLIFGYFDNKLAYHHVTAFKVNSLNDFNIIPYYHEEETEDEIIGSYNDVSLQMVQTSLYTNEQERIEFNSHSSNSYRNKKVLKFSGLLIILGMNKNFTSRTIIRKDRGTILETLDGVFSSLKIVRLEDVQFENMFSVYSDDQLGARYLLTTGFMERLLRLNQSFGNRRLEASFFNNKLLIKIDSNHKWFVPGSLFRKCNFLYDSKVVMYKLDIVFDIIKTLKLDQKRNQ